MIFSYLSLVFFVSYLFMGVYLLIENKKNAINITLFFYISAFMIWAFADIFSFNPYISLSLVSKIFSLEAIGWTMFIPFHIWFLLLLTNNSDHRSISLRYIVPLLFIISFIFLYGAWYGNIYSDPVLENGIWHNYWNTNAWSISYYFYYVITSIYALAILYFRWYKSENELNRKNALILSITLIVVLSLGTITDIILPMFKIEFPSVAAFFFSIWILQVFSINSNRELFKIDMENCSDLIVESMNEAVFLTNNSGTIVKANAAATMLINIDSNECDRNIVEYLPEEAFGKPNSELPDVFINNSFLVTNQKKKIPVSVSSAPIFDHLGFQFGVAYIVDDMSVFYNAIRALTKIQKNLNKLNSEIARNIELKKVLSKKLDDSSNKKSNYIAFMSHEIRTPMNGIIGISRVFPTDGFDNEQMEYFNELNQSAINLLNMINLILEFSRLEAGMVDLNNIKFNLMDFTRKIVSGFETKNNSIAIEFVGTDIFNVDICGDPFALEKIINYFIKFSYERMRSGRLILKLDTPMQNQDPDSNLSEVLFILTLLGDHDFVQKHETMINSSWETVVYSSNKLKEIDLELGIIKLLLLKSKGKTSTRVNNEQVEIIISVKV